jgi:hypothetical protein
MKKKLAAVFALAAVTATITALTIAQSAPAAPPSATLSNTINATNAAGTLTGTLSNLQFTNVGGVLTLVGNLTGTFTPTGGTAIPITNLPISTPVIGAAPAGSCQILDLVLGPLHLDLLGLVVDLNQVHLNITAQPGPGNLLGNLLCGVAHLLDGSGNATTLANLLNSLLGL